MARLSRLVEMPELWAVNIAYVGHPPAWHVLRKTDWCAM
jgi:hypothetical protein